MEEQQTTQGSRSGTPRRKTSEDAEEDEKEKDPFFIDMPSMDVDLD